MYKTKQKRVLIGHRIIPESQETGIMQHIRTLIVDDDDAFRSRVKEMLNTESRIKVVGEAVDGQEAIRKTHELIPNLVLMDIRMPKINGIDATKQIKQEMPGVKVLVLTLFDEEEYREVLMKNGADGYLLKKTLFDDLLPAIMDLC
jgi:DNA-binding NarL/FixJ family response regulator